MKIAVCEDDSTDLNMISEYIKNYCTLNNFMVEIHTYSSAETLLEEFQDQKFSILFLDILMDRISGIEAARKIREWNHPCIIIFITASDSYSLDAYAMDVTAYIVKPVNQKNMTRALDKCRRELIQSARFITIPVGKQVRVEVPLANLRYVEVYNKELWFHVGTQKIISAQTTLNETEELLGGEPFLRYHRSYIVNMNYIDVIKNGMIKLKTGEKLFVPTRRYAEIQLAFGRFLTNRMKEEIL